MSKQRFDVGECACIPAEIRAATLGIRDLRGAWLPAQRGFPQPGSDRLTECLRHPMNQTVRPSAQTTA